MNSTQPDAVKKMNDQQLLASTDKLVSEERRITLEVLQHLREIEVRRLFVDLGFDSMYKYCIQRLKYSEGETQRRLSSARLLRELPEIENQIQNGDLNLTNLSAVQSFIRAENLADQPLTREKKLEIISAVENKSARQVKTELIEQSHQPALLADKFQMSTTMTLPIAVTKFEASMTEKNLELLQEFRNLYAHELPDLSNQSVLLFLLKKAVQVKKKNLGLIEKMPRKPNAPLPSAADANGGKTHGDCKREAKDNSTQIEKQRKPLTAKTKRMIWKRASACCEHIEASSKTRCSSRFALEIDHIIAVALDGSNELDNLRLLCQAHNSRRSIKTFGTWL